MRPQITVSLANCCSVTEGAMVDAPDNAGGAALMIAAANNREAAVRVLLETGACAAAVDQEERTALHHALYRAAKEVRIMICCAGWGMQSLCCL